MKALISGIVFIVLGAILLIFNSRNSKPDQESVESAIPYLKNAGIGFILFGIYFLGKYFSTVASQG